MELLRAFRIVALGSKQELGVDLDDREEIVQLVRDEAGRFIGFFQCTGARIDLDGFPLLARLGAAGGFFQT